MNKTELLDLPNGKLAYAEKLETLIASKAKLVISCKAMKKRLSLLWRVRIHRSEQRRHSDSWAIQNSPLKFLAIFLFIVAILKALRSYDIIIFVLFAAAASKQKQRAKTNEFLETSPQIDDGSD